MSIGGTRLAAAVVVAVGLAVSASGCGSSKSSGSGPAVVHAGQFDIQLPDGWTVKDNTAIRPARASTVDSAGASGASSAPGASSDTVPLAKQDPTTQLFTAMTAFSTCLRGLNTKFIGVPDRSNPNSPTNDPNYIKNLTTCAAKSNILQALKAAQSAQQNLTPAQVKQQNKGYLKWRQCMISRGWGIPEPTQNAKGLLFSFGGTGGAAPNFTPPPGKDIITSTDVQDCAAVAEKAVPQATTGG